MTSPQTCIIIFIAGPYYCYNMKKILRQTSSEQKRRSEIRYFDNLMNPVPRDLATWAMVREMDEKGNVILEVQGFID
jgi:hypothetical protein